MQEVKEQYEIHLPVINANLIREVDESYHLQGGDEINDLLSKLFDLMKDNKNKSEVTIKVATINSIYSTAIQYIEPVVDKIIKVINYDTSGFNEQKFIHLVDEIATVTWGIKTNDKPYSRTNLSFASKYIHLLSERKVPIYDSYIWIIMTGYLRQYSNKDYSFNKPNKYKDFYTRFIEFKEIFNLGEMTNYKVDKFLWQMGKNCLLEIVEQDGISRSAAKAKMIKKLKTRR